MHFTPHHISLFYGVEVAILTIFQTIYLKISTEVDNDDLITMVIRAAWYAIQWEVKACSVLNKGLIMLIAQKCNFRNRKRDSTIDHRKQSNITIRSGITKPILG